MRIAFSCIGLVCVIASQASAATFDVRFPFHFRDQRSPNTVGVSVGDRVTFGTNVLPNGFDGTVGTAQQGETSVPLFFLPSTAAPNEFVQGGDWDPSLSGSWRLTFTNPDIPEPFVTFTPAPGNVRAMPFASNVRQTGEILSPTLTWENPESVDRVSITIWDEQVRFGGIANRVAVFYLPGAPETFAIPGGILEENRRYSVSIELDERYSANDPVNAAFAGGTRSRSRAFFGFTTSTGIDLPEEFFLPIVDESGPVPTFNFNNPVVARLMAFYDPLVAIGYDYAIGAGDPNFYSVLLPDLGFPSYKLLLPAGDGFAFFSDVAPLEEFIFPDGGVSMFRILGIDPALGLDPADPLAFITGLSFVADGRFTGTMTPVVFDTDSAAVIPIGPAGPLLLSALGSLAFLRRRRAAT